MGRWVHCVRTAWACGVHCVRVAWKGGVHCVRATWAGGVHCVRVVWKGGTQFLTANSVRYAVVHLSTLIGIGHISLYIKAI